MRVERDRPQHRMNDHEHEALCAEAEPQQRERQQRDRGQGVEHRGEGREEVRADARGDRERREDAGDRQTRRIAGEQDLQRCQRALNQRTVEHRVVQRLQRFAERREQQVVLEPHRVELPGEAQHQDHDQAADAGDLQKPLGRRERPRGIADRAHRVEFDHALGAPRRLHADDALRGRINHYASPWRAQSRSCRRTGDRGCGGAPSRRRACRCR